MTVRAPEVTGEGINLFGDRRRLPLKAEEFIRKILEGERDLSRISLKQGCNLSQYDSYHEMNKYLAAQNLAKEPLIISGSHFPDIIAPGLYIPHVKADCTYFGSASLAGANFAHGMFYASHFEEGSKLYYVNAVGANFESADIYADLWLANLAYAVFSRARVRRSNLARTNLFKADFSRADLMQVVQLEDAENAQTANFMRAKVSRQTRDYLAQILDHEVAVIVEAEEVIGKKITEPAKE